MGLDLYAGSLARHATRKFESPQARFARENGLAFETVYSPGMVFPSVEEAIVNTERFIEELTSALAGSGISYLGWNDRIEPYFAEQLNSRSDLALRIACACRMKPELDRPKHIPADDIVDAILGNLSTDEYFESGMAAIECQVFVPGDFQGYLPIEDHRGNRIIATSTAQLKIVLDELNIAFWRGRATVGVWFERGPAPTGASKVLKRGILPWRKHWVDVGDPLPDDSLSWELEYAFACFSKALEFSESHSVPIVRDE